VNSVTTATQHIARSENEKGYAHAYMNPGVRFNECYDKRKSALRHTNNPAINKKGPKSDNRHFAHTNSTRDKGIAEKSLLHDRIIGRWDIAQQSLFVRHTPRIPVLYNSGIPNIDFLLYNNDTMMPCSLGLFHCMLAVTAQTPPRTTH
jgi:hypothetical protein